MKVFLLLMSGTIFFVSCKKGAVAPVLPPADKVIYKTELKLLWTSPSFTIPANAHFTSFIGMIHEKNSFLWPPNGLASVGLKNVAEVGNNVKLNIEIDSLIAIAKAYARFGIPAPAINAMYDTSFSFTLQHSCISFASMIAPSPDWFVGLNNYNLLQNNQWVNDITVPLFLYDAGTEDGDVFGYNNPASNPRQPVHLLTPAGASVLANGNATFAPIGSMRFIKL